MREVEKGTGAGQNDKVMACPPSSHLYKSVDLLDEEIQELDRSSVSSRISRSLQRFLS